MKIKRGNIAGVAVLVACEGVVRVGVSVRYRFRRLKCCIWKESCIVSNGIGNVGWSVGLLSLVSLGFE